VTDNAKQEAWRGYCRKLEALGVDPYDPDIPADDPRHQQVTAIVTEYRSATSHKLALPPNWEGHEPIQPVDSLLALAEWLAFQYRLVKGWELAGDKGKPSALKDASRALHNAFRVLDWLGVEDRPERPLPADHLEAAKEQIDDLERWIRAKHKSGWAPTPKKVTAKTPPTSPKHGKRSDAIPDDEANILVRKFLEQNPKASARDVAKAVGIALGRVSDLPAWRAEVGRRQAAKTPPKKTPMPLTKKMTESIKRGDDPAAVAMAREAAWQRLIEAATGDKKAELFAMTKEQKDRLIDLTLEQYADEIADSDDEDDCS
jgi:hypothetical protein